MLTETLISYLTEQTHLLRSEEELNEVLLRARFLFEKWAEPPPSEELWTIGSSRGWTRDVIEEDLTPQKIDRLKQAVVSFLNSGQYTSMQATALWTLMAVPSRELVPLIQELLRLALARDDTDLTYTALVFLHREGEQIFNKRDSTGIDEVERNRQLAREYLRRL